MTDTFDLISNYGPTYRRGILSDHLGAVSSTSVIRVTAPGYRIVVEAGEPIPVLCSEIVRIATEDGPIDGRCGARVRGEDFACPGHQAEINRWRGQSEVETIAWERAIERGECS